ncbi:MAG: hypothetical protein EHM24_03430 [Acidobacteria bacterium]|nr:MAG: hypothetical protein EHM24_03430 [Acidobacteriota bacterium]
MRQTRCTTCDTEHEFKQAKMPTLRKKKESVSTAYKEVLAGVTKDAPGAAAPAVPAPAQPDATAAAAVSPGPAPAAAPAPQAAAPVVTAPEGLAPEPERLEAAGEAGNEDADGTESAEGEAARVHRRLIRATLPRPENHQVVRPVPEFTMRQPTGRAGKFRPAGARAQRPVAGGRAGNANAGGRGAGFSRTAQGRGAQGGRVTGRPDAHRARGGQPPRHGKKHSKQPTRFPTLAVTWQLSTWRLSTVGEKPDGPTGQSSPRQVRRARA